MAFRLLRFARITGSTGWPLCAELASGSMGQEGVNVRRLLTISLCAAAMFAAVASPARAANVLFTGAGNTVSALFVTSGTTLTVTLTNNQAAANDFPDVLTAVFFNCTGCGNLTTVSAVSSGPTYVNGGTIADTGKNVGGEWEYLAGLAGAPGGATQGISSSGFGLFGDFNFNGPNLDGPDAVDGPQYGIVSSVSASATNAMKATPLTGHDVIFVLTCSQTCTDASFSNVSFQFGTSLTEPNVGGTGPGGQNLVPEPTSLLLFGSGLAATAYRARRRNQKQQKKDS